MLDHDLNREFPELSARLHALRKSDPHFEKLFEEFDALDREIRRIEGEGSPLADAEMEKLKLRRIHLKDRVYARLTKAA